MKSNGPCHVELVDRSPVIEQLQQLDLGGAQIDDGCLDLRLVLHAQQLDAVKIDLRKIADARSGSRLMSMILS